MIQKLKWIAFWRNSFFLVFIKRFWTSDNDIFFSCYDDKNFALLLSSEGGFLFVFWLNLCSFNKKHSSKRSYCLFWKSNFQYSLFIIEINYFKQWKKFVLEGISFWNSKENSASFVKYNILSQSFLQFISIHISVKWKTFKDRK